MSYILLSFLAATFFALSLVFNKFVSNHKIEDSNSLMIYFMFSSFVFSLALFPFTSHAFPNFSVLSNIFIATSTFLVGYYLFFIGISDTDASIAAPLFQLQAIIVAVLAYLFLGERFSSTNYFWIGLIVLGVVLVSLDEKANIKSFFKKVLLLFC